MKQLVILSILAMSAAAAPSGEEVYKAHCAACHDQDTPRIALAPDGGTLALFMSADTPHEAKIATRERWSIAGWFRTRH